MYIVADEEEADLITQQLLDEIGIEKTSKLVDAPTGKIKGEVYYLFSPLLSSPLLPSLTPSPLLSHTHPSPPYPLLSSPLSHPPLSSLSYPPLSSLTLT